MASHEGLHCLPLLQQLLDTTLGSKLYLVQILEQIWQGGELSEYLRYIRYLTFKALITTSTNDIFIFLFFFLYNFQRK